MDTLASISRWGRITLFALTLALGCCILKASAEELQVVDGGAGNANNRHWQRGSERRLLVNEPDFASSKPVYFSLALGNGKDRLIAAVLDESKGSGTGYDTLYLDTNNSRDLTAAEPLKAKVSAEGQQQTTFEFEPVPVKVKYHDGVERILKVKISIQRYAYGNDEEQVSWNFNYSVEQHLEGKVSFGGKKVLLGIYDANREGHEGEEINGCFDDYGVDHLRLDLDGAGSLDAAKPDLPLSKVIAYGGKLWDLETDSGGYKVKVRPSKLATGRLNLRADFGPAAKITAGTALLLSGQGYAFACNLASPAALVLPAAKYLVEDGSVILSGEKGDKWRAAFSFPKALRVNADQAASLALGRPFTVLPVVNDILYAGRPVRISQKTRAVAVKFIPALDRRTGSFRPPS
jgi:hypothetical protein